VVKKPPPLGGGLFYFSLVFLAFTLLGLAMVRRQEVQTLALTPSIILLCKLIFCLFRVLILEWERLAPLVAPRPQISHFFAIFIQQLFLMVLF